MVKEGLSYRRISEYGLVTPARAQNPVWSFFKKYGSKKLKDDLGDDSLIPLFLYTGDPSLPNTFQIQLSRHVGGQLFSVVETARTSPGSTTHCGLN